MRNVLMTLLLACLWAPLAGQEFSKGNVYTHHVIKVRLKAGVSHEEFASFMKEEFLPAWEKHYQGIETVLLRGIRGEQEADYGWINYYDSEEELRSFYPEPGKKSSKAEGAAKKMKPYEKKMARYGSMRYAGHTTWVVL